MSAYTTFKCAVTVTSILYQAPVIPVGDASILRHRKVQEEAARKELKRELRYLDTSAFTDPVSHLLGWRVGKVVGRFKNAVFGIVNMFAGG